MNTKLKNIILAAAVVAPAFALQSFRSNKETLHHGRSPLSNQRSSGAANALGVDYSGSPLSSTTCSMCHVGGAYSDVSTIITVKNESGDVVTSYLPREQLTVEIAVSSTNSPSGYGTQLTVLTSQNVAAGTLLSPSTNNTQVSEISNVQYLEHEGISSSGVFQATFKAPDAGTGEITFYGVGLAVDGVGGSTGDNVSIPKNWTLTEEATTVTSLGSKASALAVYPNPSQSGLFTIQGEVVSFGVTDFSGSEVAQGTGAIIDISELKSGTYLLRVNLMSGETVKQKIVK